MPNRAYLDTVLVSGLARNDINEHELCALRAINRIYLDGDIELFASKIVGEELTRIPEQHRTPHLVIYDLFLKVPKVEPGPSTVISPLILPMSNPRRRTWERLTSLLPDEPDCQHLLTAQFNRIEYFVTVDEKTILKHRNKLRDIIGVKAVLPSELIDLHNHNGT